MRQLKQLLLILLILSIPSIVIAADWPPPIVLTVKLGIVNATNDAFSWKSSIIPLSGQNPVAANTSAQLQGDTTQYWPTSQLSISDVNNVANNCLVQIGVMTSSFMILQNTPAGSGFTCMVNNNNIIIEPTNTHR